MRTRLHTLVLLLALSSTPALALDQAPETLAQAFEDASASSPVLRQAEEELAAARQSVPIAWSDSLPQVSVNASAHHNDRTEQTSGTFVQQQPEYWLADVTTSWMLFAGGRTSAAVRLARGQIAQAASQYENTAQTLRLNVTRAYAGVTLARATKAAQERGLDNLQEQLRYVQANNQRGFLTLTDVAQAQARVSQAQASLAIANAQLVAAEEAFLRVVGRRPGALAPVEPPKALPGALGDALAYARDHSPDVHIAKSRLKIADSSLEGARASGRARLSLEANNSVFRDFDTALGPRQREDLLALRLNVPLFSGGATLARTRQQRALRFSAQFALDETQRETDERVATAWAGVQAARSNLTAQTARVESSELAQRGMQREQRAGVRSTIDVLNQEQELIAARIDLARARRDAEVADYELAAAIGFTEPAPGADQPPQ